jgi:hypothetical protein
VRSFDAPRAVRRARRGFPVIPLSTGAVVGFAVGVLVDVVWPNVVYGYQLAAVGVALVLLVVAIVARRRFPVALPFALATTLGLIGGIASGLAARPASPTYQPGAIEVDLRLPVSQSVTGTAMCLPIAGSPVPSIITPEDGSSLSIAGGRRLAVMLRPEVGNVRRPDGLGIEVFIVIPSADGSHTFTRMASDLASSLGASGTAAAGALTFSGLSLHPESEQRQPIEVAGTVSWTCPAGT